LKSRRLNNGLISS